MTIEIDYDKFNQDVSWDGLKGYLANTYLSKEEIKWTDIQGNNSSK